MWTMSTGTHGMCVLGQCPVYTSLYNHTQQPCPECQYSPLPQAGTLEVK